MKLNNEQIKEIYKTINKYTDVKLSTEQERRQEKERQKLIAFLKENDQPKHWYLILIWYIRIK